MRVHAGAGCDLVEACRFADDLAGAAGLAAAPPVVAAGPVHDGDVVMRVESSPRPASGAYELAANGVLTLTGADRDGLFFATRTALQLLHTRGVVDCTVRDRPDCPLRGVLLDVARKPFAVDWIEQLIRDMAAVKLNVLQLHISDGLGFRVASSRHPEMVSEPHLSADDIARVRAVAAAHHVMLIPDIDTPAHLDHVLASHPQWRLRLADGTVLPGHLDYSIPAAREFAADIVREMATLFDAPYVHLGGDEYFPAPWQKDESTAVTPRTAPQLMTHARHMRGPDARLIDGYIAYLSELAQVVEALGMTAIVWNDEIAPRTAGDAGALPTSVMVDCWVRWNDDKPSARDLAGAGYQVVNAHGDYLYFILDTHGLGTGPTKHPRGIYEGWTPRTFMARAGSGGDLRLDDGQAVAGAHLSVWCDNPASLSEDDIARMLRPWLLSFGEKAWGASDHALSYDAFAAATQWCLPTSPREGDA